jgi:hypothetical protein
MVFPCKEIKTLHIYCRDLERYIQVAFSWRFSEVSSKADDICRITILATWFLRKVIENTQGE